MSYEFRSRCAPPCCRHHQHHLLHNHYRYPAPLRPAPRPGPRPAPRPAGLDEEAGGLLPDGRPRRKKRRRRKQGTGPGARGPAKGATKGSGAKRTKQGQGGGKGGGRAPLDLPPPPPLDPDDLPKRARWTIAVTACLLLVMSMLLVGVTLRMAPIIDEMGTYKKHLTTL